MFWKYDFKTWSSNQTQIHSNPNIINQNKTKWKQGRVSVYKKFHGTISKSLHHRHHHQTSKQSYVNVKVEKFIPIYVTNEEVVMVVYNMYNVCVEIVSIKLYIYCNTKYSNTELYVWSRDLSEKITLKILKPFHVCE